MDRIQKIRIIRKFFILAVLVLSIGFFAGSSRQVAGDVAECPAGYPIDCGNGYCCKSSTPVCCGANCCGSGRVCSSGKCACPSSHPLDCGSNCCPSGYPYYCFANGKCAKTVEETRNCEGPVTYCR